MKEEKNVFSLDRNCFTNIFLHSIIEWITIANYYTEMYFIPGGNILYNLFVRYNYVTLTLSDEWILHAVHRLVCLSTYQ